MQHKLHQHYNLGINYLNQTKPDLASTSLVSVSVLDAAGHP